MLPTANRSAGLAHCLALAFVVSGALGSLVWLWWNAVWRSEIAFLPRRSPAEGIVYPPVPAGMQHAHLELSTQFKRSFVPASVPPSAEPHSDENWRTMLIRTPVAAYAEAGRFEEAVATTRNTWELALAGGQNALAAKKEKLIELFSARRPYRAPTRSGSR
jgi:hypothetical protein